MMDDKMKWGILSAVVVVILVFMANQMGWSMEDVMNIFTSWQSSNTGS